MKTNWRIVCDTNVLVSAFLREGSTPDQVISWIRDEAALYFSDATFDEFVSVFERPKFQPYLSAHNLPEILGLFRRESEFVEIAQEIELCRDPKDDKFLSVAVASQADYLITGDQDLLVLEKIEDTKILTAQAFLSSVIRRG